jgi:hypothetical protein
MTLPEEVKIEDKFSRSYKKSTHVNYLIAGDSYDINQKKFNNL